MSANGKLIARATARAYASAMAGGADATTAFEAACALYRHSHPRVREGTLRRVVAALVSHPPIQVIQKNGSPPSSNEAGVGPEADVVATQDAYIAAIARGAKPHIAFDVARAAYRARHPGLAGDALDDAVARALASDAAQSVEARGASPRLNPPPSPSTQCRAGR
jgi:hypothetical protein